VPTAAELLQRHRPFLKYDSHESYFADSAAEWTDNPGNRLVARDGSVLAVGGEALSLAFLGAEYPGGRRATEGDRIGDPSRRYAQQARALHVRPAYANRVYGRLARDSGGQDWLQYWFFYFYNDYNLIGDFIKAGLHEGDWEMIQLRLRDGTPDRAVYAQHTHAEARDWRQVDLLPGTQRPIVYVARGSHASYFEPGTQWTGHWFDQADGKRRSPELTLELMDADQPAFAWLRWPGHWGDTKKTGENPLDSDSPVGPARHAQWADPRALDGDARAQARSLVAEGPPPVPPSPPRAAAEWHDGGIRIRYEVFDTPPGRWPDGLVVTLNSPDEAEPPATERFPIEAHAGAVELTGDVDPAHRYDIHVSVATPDALASESVRLDLPPAA
jgi:Vacuolar protein sorting-associated protein 62